MITEIHAPSKFFSHPGQLDLSFDVYLFGISADLGHGTHGALEDPHDDFSVSPFSFGHLAPGSALESRRA